jgi:hypothetical protein
LRRSISQTNIYIPNSAVMIRPHKEVAALTTGGMNKSARFLKMWIIYHV